MVKTGLVKLKEYSCDCVKCRAMCKLPCWPTPEEANNLLDAGLAKSLMLDWWVAYPEDIYVLCPASVGSEGGNAPSSTWNRHVGCTFFSDAGCALHTRGLKPIEGRVAIHDSPNHSIRSQLAKLWNTEKGKAVIARWHGLSGIQ